LEIGDMRNIIKDNTPLKFLLALIAVSLIAWNINEKPETVIGVIWIGFLLFYLISWAFKKVFKKG
jgi:hypothetical protein